MTTSEYSARARSAFLAPITRLGSVLVLALAVVLPTHAQDGQDASETAMEEIVVTGIRASLDRALEVKRDASGFSDSVSAEDVGKLPDRNIAEALQRVPGVAISRNRGEGDFISIRGLGPNFVRGTINGQTLVSATETRHATRSGAVENSTGRETNFDVLPSEVISRLDVFKTPSAEHVEGGIGGVVDVQTHQPFGLGHHMSGSVQLTHRGFNGETDPSASGIASWVDGDGTFGVLGSVAYSARSIREDENDSYGYWPGGLPIDSNGDGTGDLPNVILPFANNPAVYQEDRDRLTLQGTAQWQLGDTSELALNVLYSNRDITNLGALTEIGTCCVEFSFNNFAFGDGVINSDGSPQAPGIEVVDSTAIGYQFSSTIAAITDDQIIDDDLYNIALSYDADLAGDWNVAVDAAYASAEGYLSFQRASIATYDSIPFDLTVANRQINLDARPGGPDLSDLANYFTRNADAVERFNMDDEFAVAFDATRDMSDSPWLSSIKVGARYRVRSKDRHDHTVFNVNTDQFNAGGIARSFSVGSLLDGDTPIPFGDIAFPDVGAQRDYVRSQNPKARFDSAFNAPLSYETEEATLAAYVQLDIEGNLANVPVYGDVGVRFVRTEQDIGGFYQPFRIDNDEEVNNLGRVVILDENITTGVISSDYTNVLPSLNLRFELTDDFLVRLAASESVTRPTFSQLAPGLNNINPTQRTASSGNPELVAYESTNFDLGAEWYFAETSVLYATWFTKRMDNFIGTSTQVAPSGPGQDGDGDGVEDGLGSGIERFGVGFASLSQPRNQGESEIDGLELGYQHTYGNGFGYLVNVTNIDSEALFTSGVNAGEVIPFEGVSESSYNVAVFYEDERFQVRLAHSYRDPFVFPTLSSDVFGNTVYVDDYAQLDGSFSYLVNDAYTVFFNAINITGEDRSIYSDVEMRSISLARVGARYEVGIRGSF